MFHHYPIGRKIRPPARHSTVVEDGAGVLISGRKRYCCATRTEAAGERGCGFVRCSTISQSTVTSASPARHSTVVKDGAGVVFSRRERYCCATCTKAAGERGCGFVRCSSITQSAVVSFTPARHITVVEDNASVVTSGRERYCCATRTEAAGERGCGLGGGSSITQLAVVSISPARHSTVVEDGAGVVISGRERYCCATRTEAARECGCGFVRPSSITQLAVVSRPPARHRTVVEDGAGVELPEATAVRPVPRLLVSVGVDLSDVAPLPNWP